MSPNNRTVKALGISFACLMLLVGMIGCAAQEEPDVTEDQETIEAPAEETEEPAEEPMVEDEPETPPEPVVEEPVQTGPTVPAMPGEVREYINLAETSFELPEGEAKYDHNYTASRLRSFARALRASANADWNFENWSDSRRRIHDAAGTLETAADDIQEDRYGRHSPAVKKAFVAGAEALGLFTRRFDGLQQSHSEVVSGAEALERDVLYLKQKQAAETYFRRTASLFQSLYEQG